MKMKVLPEFASLFHNSQTMSSNIIGLSTTFRRIWKIYFFGQEHKKKKVKSNREGWKERRDWRFEQENSKLW